MASLDKTAQEFEGKQMAVVDALYSEGKEELTPQELFDIGVISDDVRKRIVDVLPDAGNVFKKVMEKEKAKEGVPEGEAGLKLAFRRAFKEVYGRFVFENVGVYDSSVKALNGALKTAVVVDTNGIGSLKHRPELQAALGWLETSGAISMRNSKLKELNVHELLLEQNSVIINGIQANFVGINGLINGFDENEALLNKRAEIVISAQSIIDAIDDLFITLYKALPSSPFIAPQFELIFNSQKNNLFPPSGVKPTVDATNLKSVIDNIKQSLPLLIHCFDKDGTFMTAFEDDYSSFVNNGGIDVPSEITSFQKALIGLARDFKKKGGSNSQFKTVCAASELLSDYDAGRIKYNELSVGLLEKIQNGGTHSLEVLKLIEKPIEEIKNDVNTNNLDSETINLCTAFLLAYKKFLASVVLPTENDAHRFVEITVKPFLSKLYIRLKTLDVSAVSQKIDDLDSMMSILEDDRPLSQENIILAVFKDSGAAGLEEAKTAKRDADDDLKSTEAAREYFSKTTAPDFNGLLGKLNSQLDNKVLPASVGVATNYVDLSLGSVIVELDEKITNAKERLKGKQEVDTFDQGKKTTKTIADLTSDERAKLEKDIADWVRTRQEVKAVSDNAVNIYNSLKTFVENASVLQDSKDYTGLKDLLATYATIDPTQPTFKAESLVDLLSKLSAVRVVNGEDFFSRTKLNEFFNSEIPKLEKSADGAKKALAKLEADVKANTELSDAEAAKKIMMAVVREQMPDLSEEDVEKLAKAQLIDAMETLRTEADYEGLAERGSEKLLNLIKKIGLKGRFKGQVLDFQYKVGDTMVKPLMGLSTGDIEDWSKVEHLFEIGRLDMERGIYLLAGIMAVEGGKNTEVYPELRKHLLGMIAEKLGIDERMHEAPMRTIAEKALNDHLLKLKPLYSDHIAKYDEARVRGKNIWGESVEERSMVKSLKLRIDKLNEEYRTGEIDRDEYLIGYDEALADAESLGVKDKVQMFGLSRNKLLSSFRYSPTSQWLRDAAYYGAKRSATVVSSGSKMGLMCLWGGAKFAAKGVGGGIKLGAKGTWGGVKLGASILKQTALTPFRIAKYPLMLAAKPLIGFYNFFQKTEEEWHPYSMRETFKTDVGRVLGYTTGTASATYSGAKNAIGSAAAGVGEAVVSAASGAKETVSTVPVNEWKKFSWKKRKYMERGSLLGEKVSLDKLSKKIEKLKKRGAFTPIETWKEFTLNFDSYKEKLKKLGVEAPADTDAGSDRSWITSISGATKAAETATKAAEAATKAVEDASKTVSDDAAKKAATEAASKIAEANDAAAKAAEAVKNVA